MSKGSCSNIFDGQTDEQLEQKLTLMERIIAEERDLKNLPYHNATYQKILDELVRRDLEREDR